ncbi:unnamed protein product [Ixodes hexagonus]
MEHTLNVLAAIIKQNPAFLEALNHLIAQFMPLPQATSSLPKAERQQDPHSEPQTNGDPLQQLESERLTSNKVTQLAASENLEEMENQEWPHLGATSRKRRRSPLTAENTKGSAPIPTPTQTVVLRSIGKKEVSAFTGQEIREAVKKAGIQNIQDYTVHRNEKANAIAITTRDPLVLEKLLQVKEICKGEEKHTLQPYKAMAGNQCRGIIYLVGQGNVVTPESLLEDINCRNCTVVAARPIGTKGNTSW